MLAAPGVSCVCSDVPRSKSDRVRVENALCRSIRVTANGADGVRTVFWRTTESIGGLKVIADNGWFAVRPSGTEEVYKLYAESFRDRPHLERIQAEAQALVTRLFAQASTPAKTTP